MIITAMLHYLGDYSIINYGNHVSAANFKDHSLHKKQFAMVSVTN